MINKELLFVFRKANKGNYSIEKVYNCIFSQIQQMSNNPFLLKKIYLKSNYDFITFFSSFFSSFFSKKKIVHVTGGCNYMTLAFPFKTRILTLHDLFHFNKKKGLKGYLYDLVYYYLPIYFSNYIVVVSEKTKLELIKNFNVNQELITVIHNPLVVPNNIENIKPKIFTKDQSIKVLQIGDKPLKNYKRLLEATKNLPITYKFIHANDKKIKFHLQKLSIVDRAKIYSKVTDEQLYTIYKNCDVLFFASEEEGFGLPIIEAQSFGLMVITSNIPPMNKIGKGAIFVNPFDVDSIKKGFLKLYDQQILKKKYNDASENVLNFLPSTIALNYLNFYKSVR